MKSMKNFEKIHEIPKRDFSEKGKNGEGLRFAYQLKPQADWL